MSLPRVDVATEYRQVEGLGEGQELLIACKGRQAFERLRHRDDSFYNPRENKFNRPAPLRPLHSGGFVARARLGPDLLGPEGLRWRVEAREPREAAWRPDRVVVAMADHLALLDPATGRSIGEVHHPALRALHSVCFHPEDPDRVLVASAGVDALLELSLRGPVDLEPVWLGPEQGYGRSRAGVRLLSAFSEAPPGVTVLDREAALEALRSAAPDQAAPAWMARQSFEGLEYPMGLEYALRGSVPNWAGYGPSPQIVRATLFFAGQAIEHDRETGRTRVLLDELGEPHGVLPYQGGLLVTDTRRGRVVFLDTHGEPQRAVHFDGLPVGDSPYHTPYEWLQFTRPLADGELLLTIDGRRGALYVWSPRRREYTRHVVAPDLMLQSLVALA